MQKLQEAPKTRDDLKDNVFRTVPSAKPFPFAWSTSAIRQFVFSSSCRDARAYPFCRRRRTDRVGGISIVEADECGETLSPEVCAGRRSAGSVGFVVLSAGCKDIELWLVESADFGVVGLVEYVFVRGGCEYIEHCLAVGDLVDRRL